LGSIGYKKIVLLTVCLVLTGALVYKGGQNQPNADPKPVSLQAALSEINGWEKGGFYEIEPKIIESLKLDDYVNQSYSNGNDRVFLYIGHYFTANKVGAAHDPMVCYPGQGWMVSKRGSGKLAVASSDTHPVSYSSMIVEIGQKKELVIYWFQTADRASAGTFAQKVKMVWQKIKGRSEENAFVRITAPIEEGGTAAAQETIERFIKAFYPKFLTYIQG